MDRTNRAFVYAVALSLAVTLAVPSLSTAQVNIESQRLKLRQSGVSGSVALSVKLERGNSDLTEIELKPQAVWRGGNHQVFGLNKLSFVDSELGSIVNEGFTHLRYNLDLTPLVVYEALSQLQYNRSQDLTRRFLIGTGLRFRLVRHEHFRFAAGVTALYEYEKLETDQVLETPRNSDYLTLEWSPSAQIKLSNTVYIQPAFDDIGDIRVLDDLSLETGITKTLSLTVSLGYRYDSQPPIGIKEYDLSIQNGLKLSF